jgi:2-C-methyl-D-erythritol 4-phosphate cytidylyltransferase
VYAGLQAIDSACQLVAIHDGARPLITADLIDLTVERAAQHGAAALAVRPKDTLRRGESDYFLATLDRGRIWQMQTPQVFSHDLILSAHQQAARNGFRGTDDASLVEAIGERVFVVEGRYENIKITTPEDLIFAETILKRREPV